jgi:NAD(P)-dependent dehydrogenase (short-subunit alcohol dehydrogenase family)
MLLRRRPHWTAVRLANHHQVRLQNDRESSRPKQHKVKMSMIHVKEKVAIVTGASRGIGLAIAEALAEAGASVVMCSRKAADINAAAESLTQKGLSVHGVACHAGKSDEIKGLVAEAIKRFGKVDILINNAATNPYFGPLLQTEEAAWKKTFEVNLEGYYNATREVANHLMERGAAGSIVSVASVVGLRAAPLQGVYGMTKAAIISMTQTLALELGPSKIRVNAIAPGLVDTRLASAIVGSDDLRSMITAKTPLGRVGQPKEIAAGALFLASDASSFVTGHTLVMDGGMTIT